MSYLTYLYSRMSVYHLCIKFGLKEEHTRYNMKTLITQDLDGMSLASFCQSRAVHPITWHMPPQNKPAFTM